MNCRVLIALGCYIPFALAACRERQPLATGGVVSKTLPPAQSSQGRGAAPAVGGLFEDSPEAVVKRYLDAFFHGPARVEYECLTSADRAKVTLENFEKEREGAYEPSGVTYEIKEVQKTGDTATAVIDVLRPDVGVIDLEALAQESQKNPKEAARSTREALLRAPKVTRKRLLNLRHESDGWRVVEGLHVFQGDL